MKFSLVKMAIMASVLWVHFVQAQSTHEHSAHVHEALDDVATSYICPMHSHIIQDHPGSCPICKMDLVARKQTPVHQQSVSVSGAMQQALAIKTEVAQTGTLWRFIKTFGAIEYDETRVTHVHPRAEGWVETMAVNSLGAKVEKGQLLYSLYSPALLVAQEEMLSLLASGVNDENLFERGRNRLRLLGMTDPLIRQLETSKSVHYHVPFYATQSGVVTQISAKQGMYVAPESEMMTISNIDSVWAVADVFEHQIDWVRSGKWVEIDVPALNIFGLEGQIDFVYPALDPATRTLRVRLSLDNPEGRLKPDMLTTVRIYGGPLRDVLNIPSQALIQTGKQNRVIIKTDAGEFQSSPVQVGVVTQGRAQILSGLEVGQRVVTSGQFLLDAEASLNNVVVSGDAHHHH